MPLTTVKGILVCQVPAVGVGFCPLTPEFSLVFFRADHGKSALPRVSLVYGWGLVRCLWVYLPCLSFVFLGALGLYWGAGLREGRCHREETSSSSPGASGLGSSPHAD